MKTKTIVITTAVAAALGLGALGIGVASAHGQFGQGSGFGPGMMYNQGFGPGMMQGQGYGPGMMQGQGFCDRAGAQTLDKPLSVDDVRARMEEHLQLRGNDRLKVGNVTEKDDNIIVAEIVTVDDSLVRTIEIDKTTGHMANTPMGYGKWGGQRGGYGHWR